MPAPAFIYEAPLQHHAHSLNSSTHSTSAAADNKSQLSHANLEYQTSMYLLSPKPTFIEELERNTHYREYVLRSHATDNSKRQRMHFIGNDFVFHQPRFYYRFFAAPEDVQQPSSETASSSNSNHDDSLRHAMLGSVLFTQDCEGPPSRTHGGAIAAFFDQLLSIVAWANNTKGFTGSLSVKYEKGVPLLRHLKWQARVTSIERRKVFIDMQLFDNQTRLATSNGIWIGISDATIAEAPTKIKLSNRSSTEITTLVKPKL